jgi:hypothetical protein
MKKHIHFLLLGLGTVVFLMMMRMYTAPLTQDHDYPIKDPQWVINYTILDMNMNELHTTYIVKASLKTFAGYLAFVVIVSAIDCFTDHPVAQPKKSPLRDNKGDVPKCIRELSDSVILLEGGNEHLRMLVSYISNPITV